MRLSILTPAIPERMALVNNLCLEVEKQASAAGVFAQIEHLTLCDTRGRRTVGEKRDLLLSLARGEFVAFCDDDDMLLPGYVGSLVSAINGNPGCDVVTFRQRVTYCGETAECVFGLGNANETFRAGGVFKRAPWHVCAFKASIAKMHHFPHTNYGEDWAWARHVVADCSKSVHLDAVLHHYIHDPKTTAAPEPKK